MKRGCDVSEWQEISDYLPFKSLDFVIIREGCRQRIDEQFLNHVSGFKSVNVPIVGVYHFIYALTEADAKAEALSCLRNVEKAGLSKDVIIFCDFEYDTVDKAKEKGVYLGADECNLFSRVFCDTVQAYGYKAGIYTNKDYIVRMYTQDTLKRYLLWLADYTGEPDYPCLFQQTTKNGYIAGYPDDLDLDVMFTAEAAHSREKYVSVARSMIGWSEANGKHKLIVNIYNSFLPHPRGYKVTYTDAWCATFVSACAIKIGYMDIIPIECGCHDMIALAQKMGIWVEDDAYRPLPGDIIMYDWQDSGVGDNQGNPDHVGIVELVSGSTITVIEGNYQDAVTRRYIKVDARNIRGYIVPQFDEEEPEQSPTVYGPVSMIRKGSKGDAVKALQVGLNTWGCDLETDGDFGELTRAALVSFQKTQGIEADGISGPQTWLKIYNFLTDVVNKLSKEPVAVGTVTASELNVRCFYSSVFGQVQEYPVLGHGNKVDICGEYAGDGAWLYVRIAGKIFGFVSKRYVKQD